MAVRAAFFILYIGVIGYLFKSPYFRGTLVPLAPIPGTASRTFGFQVKSRFALLGGKSALLIAFTAQQGQGMGRERGGGGADTAF